ncbi:unnamed protein product [Phyllotreta striolata]|uniref:Zinc finger protein 865 n=1 Tax=Phyllotreta striolata TaxID=444603 RepID=A0A9N9TTP3_PHYSR|nr:unnamed protein product [Phyllotreta striolata]
MEDQILLRDSKFCRLCAEENHNGVDLFNENDNSAKLSELINKYLPIVVEENDKFPKIICPGCHIQLEATKLFMDLIIRGQLKLREIGQRQEKKMKIAELETEYFNKLLASTLYLSDHELKLRAEGLDKPKKKRGRPPKKSVEVKVGYIEEKVQEQEEQEEEELGPDGRRKRKVKAPARFDGIVQGKELDEILKKEGVIDEKKEICKNKAEVKNFAGEIIIGRIESEYGEDLGQPIFIKQKTKEVNFKKTVSFKKFECPYCFKIFIQEANFNEHLNCHKSEENATQNEKNNNIKIEFNEQATMESIADTTMEEIVKDSHDVTNVETEPKANNNKCYPCKICGKVLQHKSSLLYHKETEHAHKRFICNKCNKTFKNKQLLQRHQIVHSDLRPYICPICNSGFKTQANLMNHEAVHTKEKRFECPKCQQKFAHKTSLSLHQRLHEGKKPYTCEYCQKSFSQNGNLLEHKRIHTGEKPFFCEVCGRNFTTSSQLKIHVKRHTGEKPWECEICSKKFLHKDVFKLHLRRHYNDRPFVCSVCNKSFMERFSLKNHQRLHTGEKPYKCDYCQKTFSDKCNLKKHVKLQKCVKKTFNLPLTEKSNTLQLTQLIDQQGNPVSITTQDGQTIPIVTSGDDDNNMQGLMPDGTLVPIEISSVQEQHYGDDITHSSTLDLLEATEANELILEDTLGKGSIQGLNNFQLLTDNDSEEMCLVTYSIDENGGAGVNVSVNLGTELELQ